MNRCIYESLHGSYPECDGACKRGKDKNCPYYFVDKVYETIGKWKSEAGVDTPVLWKYDHKRNKVCLYTTKPGYLIGYHGALYQKYLSLLKETGSEYFQNGIDLIECDDSIE